MKTPLINTEASDFLRQARVLPHIGWWPPKSQGLNIHTRSWGLQYGPFSRKVAHRVNEESRRLKDYLLNLDCLHCFVSGAPWKSRGL